MHKLCEIFISVNERYLKCCIDEVVFCVRKMLFCVTKMFNNHLYGWDGFQDPDFFQKTVKIVCKMHFECNFAPFRIQTLILTHSCMCELERESCMFNGTCLYDCSLKIFATGVHFFFFLLQI